MTYFSSNESDKRLAYRRILGLRAPPPSASAGALILALRGYDRIKKKVERDLQRGRPRKRRRAS